MFSIVEACVMARGAAGGIGDRPKRDVEVGASSLFWTGAVEVVRGDTGFPYLPRGAHGFESWMSSRVCKTW